MLAYANDLIEKAILSLRTSSPIAELADFVINPHNLSIMAFTLSGARLDKPNDSYLLTRDIREISPMGFIINSSDEIVGREDVIKLKEILELEFQLPNLKVVTKQGRKIGKVSDFVISLNTMTIEQLVVERSFLRGIFDSELIIHRSKIIDISNQEITIQNEFETPKARKETVLSDETMRKFVNPFRKAPKPEVNSPSELD